MAQPLFSNICSEHSSKWVVYMYVWVKRAGRSFGVCVCFVLKVNIGCVCVHVGWRRGESTKQPSNTRYESIFKTRSAAKANNKYYARTLYLCRRVCVAAFVRGRLRRITRQIIAQTRLHTIPQTDVCFMALIPAHRLSDRVLNLCHGPKRRVADSVYW
jgi:RNase P protein component